MHDTAATLHFQFRVVGHSGMASAELLANKVLTLAGVRDAHHLSFGFVTSTELFIIYFF